MWVLTHMGTETIRTLAFKKYEKPQDTRNEQIGNDACK